MQSVIDQLDEIAKQYHCHTVVSESADGMPEEKAKKFPRGGLLKYAQAVGQITQHFARSEFAAYTVRENEWTMVRGQMLEKEWRAKRVEALFPDQYSIAEYDTALRKVDAIALGLWWLKQDERLASA